VHDEISAKLCDNCIMIMMNYVDLWLMHSQVASQFKGVKLELRELKAHSSLLGACISCPLLISDLEVFSLRLNILSTNLSILLATMSYPLNTRCVILSRVSFFKLSRKTPS
jgi:hypothetical protein